MVTYKGYPIRKRQTGYKSHVWDLIVEEHDRNHITGRDNQRACNLHRENAL